MCNEEFYNWFANDNSVRDIVVLLICTCLSLLQNILFFVTTNKMLGKLKAFAAIFSIIAIPGLTLRYVNVYGDKESEKDIVESIRLDFLTHPESDLAGWFEFNVGEKWRIPRYVHQRHRGSALILRNLTIPWTILQILYIAVVYTTNKYENKKIILNSKEKAETQEWEYSHV